VTVGIPVYNGAATLEETVRSIQAQTFTDFEILISDNASTDRTAEIAQRLAQQDPRIRYVRQKSNVGANGNYSFVARDARGEFLKWCSCSDWCAPTFLEQCVKALDANPGAVLAAPRTRLFEGSVDNARDYAYDIAITGETPSIRFRDFMSRFRLNNAFNGVIRLRALRLTRLIEPYLEADLVLMGNLALLGQFALVEEPLFYRRMEVASSTTMQSASERLKHHYPVLNARTLFQECKQQIGYFRAGLSAPMGLAERGRVVGFLLRRLVGERGALMDDVRNLWRFALRRPT
jgi:glycosyltransferase involved in cell wall biosynthesis